MVPGGIGVKGPQAVPEQPQQYFQSLTPQVFAPACGQCRYATQQLRQVKACVAWPSSLSDWGMKGIATDGVPKKQAFLSPTRRFQRGFGAIFCFYPAFRRNTAMRLRFQARQTSVHSPETLRRPRSENWRNPITDLMMPNTGSTVCLRSA